MTTTIDDLAEMIKEKEKELLDMKREYRERRTEGLRSAIEQRKEAACKLRHRFRSYIMNNNNNLSFVYHFLSAIVH